MAANVPSNTVHTRPVQRFGGFEIDPRSRELRRKGYRVRLQDQPLEVLLMLLERRGEVVTREELKRRLWPAETFVDSDDGLNGAIRKLREALGDSAETPLYVETIPRRGYRFIGTIEEEPLVPSGQAESGSTSSASPAASAPSPADAGSKRAQLWWLLAAAAIITAAVTLPAWMGFRPHRASTGNPAAITSLAVLPFSNVSGDPSQEYFSDAMTDEMTSELAKIGALRVISRTSAMHYKGTSPIVPQIARELNVDGLIEGSVLRTGNRVRITVQLIDARSDRHIWSESYERDLGDILALQRDLSHTIADQVRAAITPAEEGHLRPASVNPAAYDDYLLGTYFSQKRTPAAIEKATEHFRSAIQTDPKFARAYAGLAQALFEKEIWAGIGIGKAGAEIRAATLKALQLDSNLAEGHMLMARIHFQYDWDWNGTEDVYKRSLELNSGLPETHGYFAYFLQSVGRQGEALTEAHQAVVLDPLSPSSLSDEGRILYRARQYDRAIADYKRALEIDPGFIPALSRIAEAYEQEGKFDDALASARQYQKQAFDSRLALPYLARIYAHMGKRREAMQALKEIEAARDLRKDEAKLIAAYAALGDLDRAIALLDRAVKGRSALPFMFVDPQLDPLRSDPRFNELLHHVGLR